MVWIVFLLWPAFLAAQSSIPVILGRTVPMLPPAVDASGRRIALAAAVDPSGTTLDTTDLYVAAPDGSGLRRLTRAPQDVNAVALSPDGARAALTEMVSGVTRSAEEVHLVDVATGADRTLTVDTEGCIQPLCVNCFFHCVNTPHLTPDGTKVLYSVRRQEPFRMVNADGTGLTRLPVFSGFLAPAPQRVISRNGLIVFSSSAPSGPTFAASATDVYVISLDGTGLRNITKFGNDPSIFTQNATISADGGTVTFETNRDTLSVWIARTDGTGVRALTTGEPSSSPSISADGSLVAFVRAGQIYVMRSDGTGLRALTNFKMSAAQDPVISDDGSRVVFNIGPRAGERGAVYAVDVDGKNLRPVYAPRALNRNGVNGVVDFSPPSPGSLISAYGINLSDDALTSAARFPLPESLAGLSLLVNGRAVPLVAVTPWQVNAQLPPETVEGPAAFQFRFADGFMPAAGAAQVKVIAPAILSYTVSGTCQAAALHGGTHLPADRDNPAAAGEALEIYGVGLGPAHPFVAAGVPAPSSPPAETFRPDVLIGGRRAEVLFAGLTPGFAGLYQVNAVVPAGLRAGAQAIQWRAGDIGSAGCGAIWVR